jgi:hypothetical protein
MRPRAMTGDGEARPALRIARLLVFVLLGLGVVAAIVGAIWIQLARGDAPPQHDFYRMSSFRRGLLLFAHSSYGSSAVIGLPIAAIGGGVLAWFARKQRWPLAVIAAAALLAIVAVWSLRDEIAAIEPSGYRARSVYVQGATRVAYGGTLYFAALAAAAGAAFVLARTRKTDLPGPAAPGTMNPGGAV